LRIFLVVDVGDDSATNLEGVLIVLCVVIGHTLKRKEDNERERG
jgi:hypothetical protein